MTNTPKDSDTDYVLVPREPTAEMKTAGLLALKDTQFPTGYGQITDAYRAMVSAAPASSCAGELKPMRLPCDCYEPNRDACACGNTDDAHSQGYAQGWNDCLKAQAAPAHGWISVTNVLSVLRSSVGYIPKDAESLNGNVRDEVHALIKQIESNSGWLPINSAPTDGTGVIVWCEPWKDGAEARYVEDEGWYLAQEHPTDYHASQIYPTLWMPLPKAPQGNANG